MYIVSVLLLLTFPESSEISDEFKGEEFLNYISCDQLKHNNFSKLNNCPSPYPVSSKA